MHQRNSETVAWLLYGHRLADGSLHWNFVSTSHEKDLGGQTIFWQRPLVYCKFAINLNLPVEAWSSFAKYFLFNAI